MATDFTSSAVAYIGINAVFENFAAAANSRFITTGSYSYENGSSSSENMPFVSFGTSRELPNPYDYTSGAYPVIEKGYRIDKNISNSADSVPLVPGSSENAFKRKAINVYMSSYDGKVTKALEMLSSLINSDIQAIAKKIDLETLQGLFATIPVNSGTVSGFVDTPWESRPGYVAGVDIDLSGLGGDDARAERIIVALEANKASLAIQTGLPQKVVVTLPTDLTSLLTNYLMKNSRFTHSITEVPSISSIRSRGMFMLGPDMIIIPFDKLDMNSTGDPIQYECGMFYQGAIKMAYTPGQMNYNTSADNIDSAVQSAMTYMNTLSSPAAYRTMGSVYWSSLMQQISEGNQNYNPFMLDSLIGFQMFEKDPTASGGTSWELSINYGTAIGQGNFARKFFWLSGETLPPLEKGNTRIATRPNYHPDTIIAKERRLAQNEEFQKSKRAPNASVSFEELQALSRKVEEMEKSAALNPSPKASPKEK